MQKYIRLLSYENACKLIEFINTDKEDYANITSGGVSVRISEKNYPKMETFLKELNVRYEISDKHPYKIHEEIVNSLKEINIINSKSN